MKQFLKKIFTGYSAEKFVSTLLAEHCLLCPNCGHKNPITAGNAFDFQNCARCDFAILAPYTIAGFVLFEPLGAGGICSVYKAYHRDTGADTYAIKIMRQDRMSDPESVDVFMREVEIHQAIPAHPNIVRFVDSGHEDDEYYYAIEFVSGERLQSLLDHGRTFLEQETLQIITELLSALQHVLNCGILYRDVSAGNIILDRNRIILIDFGLAMPVEEALEDNHDKTIWGTGAYIPPERICRGGENESSVIYSIGMLIFHMATGKAFVKSTNIADQAKRHVSAVRLAVTPSMMPGYSPQLVNLVSRMIRQDPCERPQEFVEVAAIIAEMCDR